MSRILSLTVDYTKDSGGSALSAQQFSLALGAQIVSLTNPITLRNIGSYSDDCIHIPVHDSILGTAYNYLSAENSLRLRQLIRGADLVVCHKIFRYHNQVILQECLANGIPYAIVPHGSLDPWVFTYGRMQKKLWFTAIGKRYFRNASVVIYATDREMQKSEKLVPYSRGAVMNWYVPEPHDLDRDICRKVVCERYGLEVHESLYLMLGRLHAMKRVFEAIRGFKSAKMRNAALVIAGSEGDYSVEQIKSYAVRIGAKNVHVVGPVFAQEKEELLAACDYSLNTSHRENYCYSIVEGMSYGLPAILTPGNDLAATLERQGCALRCETYDDEALIAALRKSASMDDVKVAEMRMRSREWVRLNATYSTFARNLNDLVGPLMSQHARTSSEG